MSELASGCIVMVFVLGGLAFVVSLVFAALRAHDAKNKARGAALRSLASRWNGQVTTGYFAADHKLALTVDGIPGEVTFYPGSKNSPAWTRIQFNAPSARRLRVVPESFSGWLSRLFGGGDLVMGESAFDDTFWVEASNEEWAREVLNASLRRGLLKLRDRHYGFGGGKITLDVGPAGVSLRIGTILLDEIDALEAFIELGIEALRQMRGGAEAGVVLAAVEIRGGSECPVCGHSVEGGTKCPSCRTPHHDDCWKYSAGCAIFACEGRAPARRGAA